MHVGSTRMNALQTVNVADIIDSAAGVWQSKCLPKMMPDPLMDVRNVPDNCRVGFRMHVYKRWFAQSDWVCKHSFIYNLFERDQICVVAQFRMGVHWLNNICMPRSTQRSKRTCACCFDREDEMHLFECPFYADFRQKYHCNLPAHQSAHNDADMLMLMNGGNDQESWRNFANFLLACKGRYTKYLLKQKVKCGFGLAGPWYDVHPWTGVSGLSV